METLNPEGTPTQIVKPDTSQAPAELRAAIEHPPSTEHYTSGAPERSCLHLNMSQSCSIHPTRQRRQLPAGNSKHVTLAWTQWDAQVRTTGTQGNLGLAEKKTRQTAVAKSQHVALDMVRRSLRAPLVHLGPLFLLIP